MAQIGFTLKQEHVYARFQTLRRAYEDAHGRTYAPGFLTVLMDAWEGKADDGRKDSKTGWSGIDPEKFLYENGFRGYEEPENETE